MAESPITMFGVYVSKISAKVGWGGQGSTMQLTLVEDEVNGVVLDKDSSGNPFYGSPSSPKVGSAIYFKYGNFYFGGIFQRWSYSESVGGRTYDIIAESPTKLMDGVHVIFEEWNGTTDYWANQYNNYDSSTNLGDGSAEFHLLYGTNYMTNVFNVFGYYENPTYGINGNLQNFGAANTNTAGMQISKLFDGMNALIDKSSSHAMGGPIMFGTTTDPNEAATLYSLNIDDIYTYRNQNNVPFGDYRIKGPYKSVNAIMGEVSELFQFDYYFALQHRNGTSSVSDGGGLIPDAEIKVKVIDKSEPPEPGKIKSYIDAELAKPENQRRMTQYEIGKEFGDTVTQKVLWGGRRTRYQKIGGNPIYDNHSLTVGDMLAIFGRNNDARKSYNIAGTVSQVYGNPSQPVDIYLDGYGIYKASPFEMRFAMGGKEVWEIFKTFQTIAGAEPNGYNNIYTCPWTGKFDATGALLTSLGDGRANGYDMTISNIEIAKKGWFAQQNALSDLIHKGVSGVASSSYAQEFLCYLPNESPNTAYNVYVPADEYQEIKSWEIASSAFDSRPSTFDIASFDAVGRVTSLVGYDIFSNADYSGLGSDYAAGTYSASGKIVSRKGSPEGEAIWNPYVGTWMTVFKAGCQIPIYDGVTTPDFGLTVLASYFFNINIPPEAYILSGKQSVQFACPPDMLMPSFFGIPQESQRFNYGPWLTLNKSAGGYFSPFGKAQVERKESMRPETFGSYEELERIGGLEAQVGKSDMQEVESGSMTVVGKPDWNMGERFATTGPYVSDMSIDVDATGGVTTSYQFNTWTPNFGTMTRYNIARIQDIYKRTFDFGKKNRDEVEKRPFPKLKFEKTDLSDLSERFSRSNGNALQMGFRLSNF